MKKTVDTVPFLRLTAALSAGIIMGLFLQADEFIVFLLLLAIAAAVLWLNNHYQFSREVLLGAGIHLFFIATGLLICNWYNRKPEFPSGGKHIAVVQEILQEKANSYQSLLKLSHVLHNDTIIRSAEKVIVYFEKDSASANLVPGQTIFFLPSPQQINNNSNPFEFNYKRYMERRKVYRQVYLPSESWTLTERAVSVNVLLISERLRMKMLNIYRQKDWNAGQLNILSSLTLGYRRGLSAEIKETFASSGAMHILAVSGLHTGIIFLVVNFLFRFLKQKRFGRFLFVLVVVTTLWSYAFLTGLSPSVMRAATMFSFLVTGKNLRRQVNTYNSLAASAFLLLLINPNNLLDAGFQLSYSAVFGILFLQPRFEKLIVIQPRLLKYFWSILTVSMAAQIATFPVSAYYFNQFPVFFWLSNLLIIPAVTLLIPLGFLLLVTDRLHFLSELLTDITGYLLDFLLDFLRIIENLPYSVVTFHLTEADLLFLLLALLSSLLFIRHRTAMYFKATLLFVFLFSGSSFVRETAGYFRSEIIVYDYKDQDVVHFISGKDNYVVSEKMIQEGELIQRYIQNTIQGFDLNPPGYLIFGQLFNDSVLYVNDGFILFDGKVVHFTGNSKVEVSPFEPDVIIGQPSYLVNH